MFSICACWLFSRISWNDVQGDQYLDLLFHWADRIYSIDRCLDTPDTANP